MSDVFWNKTMGERPAEPAPGLFAKICSDVGRHVYDDYYGPLVCARCGHDTRIRPTRWQRFKCLLGLHQFEPTKMAHTYQCVACPMRIAGHV